MGFGPFSTESNAEDNRIAVTDSGRAARGRENLQLNDSVAVTHGGRYTSPNSVMLGDKSGNSTTTIGKGGSLTINQGVSGAALTALLGQVQTANSDQINALRDAIANRNDATASGDPNAAVAADQQIAAAPDQGKGFNWWIVGLVALAGLAAWKFFKK